MVTATFHFYGNLNDFLAPKHRHRVFTTICAQSATTKHMIEALGVPHTEVGYLRVNHVPATLGQLLKEGDYVSVYCSTKKAVNSEIPEISDMHEDFSSLHFLADSHLGGLGRLLRMAGFDTLYDNHFHDDDIVEIACRENRIVLTRDRELLKRRDLNAGCYIRSLKPPQQLREVVERFTLARQAHPFSLCLHCNRQLREVSKETVYHLLPPSVQEHHNEFRMCDCCKRVYWKGTHWQRMRALLDEIVV